MNKTAVDLRKKAFEATFEMIESSFLPHIFRQYTQNSDKETVYELSFTLQNLPAIAERICKFSGVLLQIYWVLTKTVESSPPHEIDELLKQIWGGNRNFDNNMAFSLLREVSISENELWSDLVREPGVVRKWQKLINSRGGSLKEFRNKLAAEGGKELFQDFQILIESLPVLNRVKLKNGRFHVKGFEEGRVSQFPFLYEGKNRENSMYLYSVDSNSEKMAVKFIEPYYDRIIKYEFLEHEEDMEEFLHILNMIGLHNEKIEEKVIYLFSDDYEYIQNLAKVIKKHASEKTVQQIKDEYFYKTIVAGPDESKKMDDVEILTLILANFGPSSVLETILNRNLDAFYENCLEFFKIRGHENVDKIRQKQEQLEANRIKRIEETYPSGRNIIRRNELIDKTRVDTRIWAISKVSGLGEVDTLTFVDSIEDKIDRIEEWAEHYKSNAIPVDQLSSRYGTLVEETLKFLICFYSGLVPYHEKFEKMSREDNPQALQLAEDMMCKKAERMYEVLKNRNLRNLRDFFQNLVAENLILKPQKKSDINAKEFTSDSSSELTGAEILEKIIGRKYVCSDKKFSRLAEKVNTLRNDFSHDRDPKTTEKERKKFPLYVRNLFNFFRYGNDYESFNENEYSLEPIYPITVTLTEVSRKQDGMLIYNYGFSNNEINILSPRQYLTNEKYYCLPKTNKSTSKWWLDPLLIRCKKFDSSLK